MRTRLTGHERRILGYTTPTDVVGLALAVVPAPRHFSSVRGNFRTSRLSNELSQSAGPMPLARIITKVAEDSLELTMQLRARGFKVETVAPGQVCPTPADVEVHLDDCDAEQALSAAASAPPDEDLYVFVAPGALDERARPIKVVPLFAPSEEPAVSSRLGPASATVLPFVPPEDDPILAELENERILAELEAVARAAGVLGVAAEKPASAPGPPEPAVGIPVTSSPVAAPRPAAPGLVEETPPSAKAPVSVESGEFWIPQVPDRPPIVVSANVPAVPRTARPVVKVSVRTGPKFWRTVWASTALLFLGGTLALVVVMRPPTPRDAARSVEVVVQPAAPRATPATPALPGPSVQGPTRAGTRSGVAAADVVLRAAQLPKPKASKRARHPRSSHADGMIAEDTVVFYDRSHAVSPAKVVSQSRKYNDRN